MNTAIVAMAIAADNWAAQRFHQNNPTPAITYAKPATKLNQRTKGTILPAAARCSAPPNRVFPPTMTVTMPNTAAISAAAMVQRGRWGLGSTMTCLFLAAVSAVNFALARAMRDAVSYTHLRAHETRHDLVCRL